MIVYLLTCRPTGLKYVGQTEASLEERWAKHVASSRCPRSAAYKLMPVVRAIAEHGSDSFDRRVLEECATYKQMDEAEIRLIAEFRTMDPTVGYNRSPGGDAPMRGKKHAAESIEKMRRAKLNVSDETRAAMREGQARANSDPRTRAKKSKAAKERNATMFTPEVRAKISRANSGENNASHGKRFGRSANPMPHTEEAKRRMSVAHAGKKLSEEHKAAIALAVVGVKSSPRGLNRRPVHVFEDGVHVASYLRLEFLAEDVGVSLKTMRQRLRDGYNFGERRYVQDESTISALRSK